MGMTWKRAGFAALVLVALMVSLQRPSREDVEAPASTRQGRLNSLFRGMLNTGLIAGALTQRDAALRMAEGSIVGGGRPTVVTSGYPQGTDDPGAQAMIDQLWGKLGTTDRHVSTIVIAYHDTSSIGRSYTGAVVTQRDSTLICVALVPAFGGDRFPMRVTKEGLNSAVAPCALLSAFGRPGVGVAAWLNETRFVSAQSNNWLTRPRGFHEEDGPWLWYETSGMPDRGSDLISMLDPIGLADLAVLVTPTYAYGAEGLRCITGEEAACVRSVIHPGIAGLVVNHLPEDVTLSRWMARPDSVTLATVRPAVPTFISTMVLEFGRERFRRFWQSDRPIDEAFQEAFGEPLGHYTARWAKAEWEASSRAKYRGSYLELGVTLKPAYLLACAGWSLVAFLITAMVARRRHV